jgi:hypothetical protein
VWKLTPQGERRVFASGLYAAHVVECTQLKPEWMCVSAYNECTYNLNGVIDDECASNGRAEVQRRGKCTSGMKRKATTSPARLWSRMDS